MNESDPTRRPVGGAAARDITSGPDGFDEPPPVGRRGLSIAEIAKVVRRDSHVVLLCVAVAAVIALVLAVAMPRKYTATASVSVAPFVPVGSSGRITDQVNMQSEASIATSTTVAERAVKRMPEGTSVQELRANVKATVPSQSLILKFTATSPEERWAVDAANAMAAAYLQDRQASARTNVNRIGVKISADIAALTRQRAGAASPAVQARLDSDIANLRKQQSELLLVSTNPGRIVTTAALPAKRSTPPWWTIVVGALALGAIVGVFVALMRSRSDRIVRWSDRLTEVMPGPVLIFDDQTRTAKLRDALGVAMASASAHGAGPLRVGFVSIAPDGSRDVVDGLARVAAEDEITVEVATARLQDIAAMRAGGVVSEPVEEASEAQDEAAGDEALAPGIRVSLFDASGADLAVQAMVAQQLPATICLVSWKSERAALQALAEAFAHRGVRPAVVLFRDDW